ncbi:MAG: ammonium transporter [Candidatus Riflemargulisbacteria bacterium]
MEPVVAAVAPYVDFGNTAWMLMCSALVLLMTAPGLGLFYGGLVKRRNILSILMQSMVTLALVSIIWVTVGYSLAFGPGHGALAGFIGGLDWAFLKNVGMEPSPYYISQATARIPHLVFMIFQCMFAVITPALIIGAFAERMKFSAFMLFTIAWSLLVYSPVAHMVWSANGWLFKMGALDFAGGTVVHITAGIASLVVAIMIGRRKYLKSTPPHNLVFTMMGAALLWFGWFGFNAGSGLAADGLAASAFVVTHIAASMAALAWGALDWLFHRKPTMLGIATGAVAGLVAITPAAGFVDITGALIIGALVSVFCYFFVMVVKNFFKYDDALDAFGVHGIGGIWGAIATGLFATPVIQSAYKGFFYGNPDQLRIQLIAVGVSIVYSLIVTIVIYKVIDLTVGMRVNEKDEAIGLDVSQHNERAYTLLE